MSEINLRKRSFEEIVMYYALEILKRDDRIRELEAELAEARVLLEEITEELSGYVDGAPDASRESKMANRITCDIERFLTRRHEVREWKATNQLNAPCPYCNSRTCCFVLATPNPDSPAEPEKGEAVTCRHCIGKPVCTCDSPRPSPTRPPHADGGEMKIEEQCVSLELSKRLKELGVKQESLCYWTNGFLGQGEVVASEYHLYVQKNQDDFCRRVLEESHDPEIYIYAAFTVAELGELLGKMRYQPYSSRPTTQVPVYKGEFGWIMYEDGRTILEAKTEADARAMLLIRTIENNFIAPTGEKEKKA